MTAHSSPRPVRGATPPVPVRTVSGALRDTGSPSGPVTALGADGAWDPRAARHFRYEHGLSLIDAAARACGVFDRRWVSGSGERAVGVVIRERRWVVYPVDTGWVAAPRDETGEPDLAHSVWLQRRPGERRVPTAAWGQLLATDTPVTHEGSAPPPHADDRPAAMALFGR